ncbi:MAG: thiamine-phosphate kinase [Bacteroidota bacterium]|jgi:thiamine-monophosphate kinase
MPEICAMIEDPNPQRTPLSELGEFGLIERLTADLVPVQPSTVVGVGDDAAVLRPSADQDLLVSTDLLVEGVHFDLAYVPLQHLGYKAAVVNFSDIYAMGGSPTQLTVAMAVSSRYPVEALDEIYAGIRRACAQYGVDLVGGDTTSNPSGLSLALTVIGQVERGAAVGRGGAQATDLIVVSGDLGGAYIGLQVLEREKATYLANPNLQPDLSDYQYPIERQLKPEARKDIVELLAELGVKPTSMMDVSDGLSSELLHLTKASGLGCVVFEDKLPIDPVVLRACEEFGIHPVTAVLNGGEDYELVFTVSLEDYDKIKGNPNITPIGHMTASEGRFLVNLAGEHVPLTAQGWKAFSSK